MTNWIGVPGALSEFECVSTELLTVARVETPLITVGGHRSIQIGRRDLREWDVTIDVAEPWEVAVLSSWSRRARPLTWVGEVAHRTNLLTPGEADLMGSSAATTVVQDGALPLSDGRVAVRYAVGVSTSDYVSLTTGSSPVPVLPGRAVTFSVYASSLPGGVQPRMSIAWVDSLGNDIGSLIYSYGPSAALVPERWARTLTPPEGAVGARFFVERFSRMAMPAVTWTGEAQPWTDGRGVRSVYLGPVQEAPIMAAGRVLASYSTRFMEVGD